VVTVALVVGIVDLRSNFFLQQLSALLRRRRLAQHGRKYPPF
jgi:hypothetical protein